MSILNFVIFWKIERTGERKFQNMYGYYVSSTMLEWLNDDVNSNCTNNNTFLRRSMTSHKHKYLFKNVIYIEREVHIFVLHFIDFIFYYWPL